MGEVQKFIREKIDRVITENKPIMLMEDLNLNYLLESYKTKIDSILEPYGLNLVNSTIPTRIQNRSATLIDYTITDLETSKNVKISDAPFNTDHEMTTTFFPNHLRRKEKSKNH